MLNNSKIESFLNDNYGSDIKLDISDRNFIANITADYLKDYFKGKHWNTMLMSWELLTDYSEEELQDMFGISSVYKDGDEDEIESAALDKYAFEIITDAILEFIMDCTKISEVEEVIRQDLAGNDYMCETKAFRQIMDKVMTAIDNFDNSDICTNYFCD